MMYLTGANHPVIRPDFAAGTMGLMQNVAKMHSFDGVNAWALDNGAFTGKYPGDTAYLNLLDRLEEHRETCLFVAVPDVVGDSAKTLAIFPDMARRIRARGWPVALVGQDGMESEEVPWHLADWLFVGGSTEWKLGEGAQAMIAQAKSMGKRVHVGRVNSRRRYEIFARLGCDSADGTYISFGPNVNVGHVRKWIKGRNELQEVLL